MMSKSIAVILLLLGLLISSIDSGNNRISCGSLNTDHLLHLYAEIELPGKIQAGIVHIYSEAPDYKYAIEPDEGYTCVDDVARAIVLLSRCEKNDIQVDMLNRMVNFILYMQSEEGYFYNFIWHNGSINKTYRTSQAKPDWWSWRAFWAMEEYAKLGQEQSQKISQFSHRLAEKIFEDFLAIENSYEKTSGMVLPTWLPGETAADQAAVLVLALESYYKRTEDKRATELINKLCEGILQMQAGKDASFPYGAFLSWQNLWHAYGNSQAVALLKAGKLLDNEKYIKQALLEIDHFYPWLAKKNYMNFFSIEKQKDSLTMTDQQQFPQIAYGFRPIVYACIEAYEITNDKKYFEQAKRIGAWFAGENAAGKQIYNPSTGRCYDAINSAEMINFNSGAESTIEALLSLQAMENAGINLKEVFQNE